MYIYTYMYTIVESVEEAVTKVIIYFMLVLQHVTDTGIDGYMKCAQEVCLYNQSHSSHLHNNLQLSYFHQFSHRRRVF